MSSAVSSSANDTRRHLLHALRRVLRPIIRLLIRHGVRYDAIADVARAAYVESAVRDGIGDNKHPTREQITWATGVSRQRVDHYIDDDMTPTAVGPIPIRIMSEVLHVWHTDPQYLDTQGNPIELNLDASSGATFRHLVRRVNSEVSADLVLERLLEAKTVISLDGNRFRSVTRFFIQQSDYLASIDYFGETLAHLIETQEYNLEPENADKKRLDRSVFPDRKLPAVLVPDFHTFAKERTSQFLLELDDWLARFSDINTDQSGTRMHSGVNVFFYIDELPDAGNLSTLIQPRRVYATPRTAP